jgi:tripartite-type tricarboxylate transporter receptor subunit TctC
MLVHAQGADAQWPAKPVRIVVASPPGGPTDTYMRVIAAELTKSMGQQFYVDNVAGAAGKIACMQVLNSKDGHTILFTTMSSFVLPNLVDKQPAFDVMRDFKAIAQLCNIPLFMITSAQLPARNVSEFIAYAKAHPDAVSYASLGMGSAQHFVAEQFKEKAGIQMLHVPYKGEAAVLLDLAPNVVQVYFTGTAKRAAADPRLRVLAVASPKRWFSVPDVPTLEEQGVPGIHFLAWNGLFAPNSMSDQTVRRLNAAVNEASASESSKGWLVANGYERVGGTPAGLAQRARADIDLYGGMVKSGKVKGEG